MDEATVFSRGDLVIHPRRPEWGTGVVDQVTTITHEGRSAQRLVVKFQARGRVAINTAVAPLASAGAEADAGITDQETETRKDAPHPMSRLQPSPAKHNAAGWLGKLAQRGESNGIGGPLQELPDAMVDPFNTAAERLQATVESFRFGENPAQNPRGLIEWAAAQTGKSDPLTDHTRHELEEAFVWFGRKRDRHLLDLVRDMKRNGQRAEVEALARQTRYPAARIKLERALRA